MPTPRPVAHARRPSSRPAAVRRLGLAMLGAAMLGCGLPTDTNPCVQGVTTRVDLVSAETGGVRLSGEPACVHFAKPHGPLQVEMTREGRSVFYVQVEQSSNTERFTEQDGSWSEGANTCAEDLARASATVDSGPAFSSTWNGGACSLQVTQLPSTGTFAGDFRGTLGRASPTGQGTELLDVGFSFSIPLSN